jgi:hypothetical protein
MGEKDIIKLILEKYEWRREKHSSPSDGPISKGLAFSDLEKIELIVYKRTFMPGEAIVYKSQPGGCTSLEGLIELPKRSMEKG